jgi:hypothetical protein
MIRKRAIDGILCMPQPPTAQIIEKVKKLSEIAEALRQGNKFHVTRLTIIKSLCSEPEAATAYALFLCLKIQKKMRQKKYPEQFRELVDRAASELKSHLADPNEDGKAGLASLCREMASAQKGYKKLGRNAGRMLKCMDLVLVEECVRSVLSRSEAPFWAYHASKDYVVRFDPRYGFGLIPNSAPMVEEIAEFWRKYFGIEE